MIYNIDVGSVGFFSMKYYIIECCDIVQSRRIHPWEFIQNSCHNVLHNSHRQQSLSNLQYTKYENDYPHLTE